MGKGQFRVLGSLPAVHLVMGVSLGRHQGIDWLISFPSRQVMALQASLLVRRHRRYTLLTRLLQRANKLQKGLGKYLGLPKS